MKIFILLTTLLLTSLAPGLILPSEQRTNGPLIREVFNPVQTFLQKYSAVVYEGNQRALYATVISSDGLLITKASELSELKNMRLRIGREWYENPQILKTDAKWDIAFLKVDATDLTPADWAPSSALEHGTWVVSNGSTTRSKRRVKAGIISANPRQIDGPSPVVLGVQFQIEEGKGARVSTVNESSGAAEANVKKGDLIAKINDTEITSTEILLETLSEKQAGEKIALEIIRDEKTITLDVELKLRVHVYKAPPNRNDQMSGLISDRRDSFPRVIQHDTMLSKETMGGPLLTLDGKCVGINIAYANRVESFAIPSEEAQQIIQAFLEEKKEQ